MKSTDVLSEVWNNLGFKKADFLFTLTGPIYYVFRKITNHNLEYNKQAYSAKVANTNSMQESIHASIAVRPSALGVLVVTVLKMLTNTRKSVTSNAIRPVWEIRRGCSQTTLTK